MPHAHNGNNTGPSPLQTYGLPLAGNLAKSFGDYFLNQENRGFQQEQRGLLRGLRGDLRKGITKRDISGATPLLLSAAMPGINRIAGRAAGKFGSTSGVTLGKTIQGFNQSLAPGLARLYQLLLTNRQQNLRTMFNTTAQLSR